MNFLFIVVQIKLVFSQKNLHSLPFSRWVFLELFITRKEANSITFVSVFVCFDNHWFILCARLFHFLGLCIDDDDDEFSESDYDDDNDDGNNEDDATDHDELWP